MKKPFFVALVALLLVPSLGMAQDYGAGAKAYRAKDFEAALNIWKPLAETGDIGAQMGLAILYEEGNAVPQDYTGAANWFRLAAKQGDARAQSILGTMYLHGDGVSQDFTTAHMWLDIASGNGSEIAAKKMTPAEISEARLRAKICVASDYQDCE